MSSAEARMQPSQLQQQVKEAASWDSAYSEPDTHSRPGVRARLPPLAAKEGLVHLSDSRSAEAAVGKVSVGNSTLQTENQKKVRTGVHACQYWQRSKHQLLGVPGENWEGYSNSSTG